MKILQCVNSVFEFIARILFWVWPKKHFKVSVYGKEETLYCENGGTDEEAQEYAEKNVVICASCGKMMFPGRKFCIREIKPEEAIRPGVLLVSDELIDEPKSAVVCLRPLCGSVFFMRGSIGDERRIEFFPSPIDLALHTEEGVVIPDIEAHKG